MIPKEKSKRKSKQPPQPVLVGGYYVLIAIGLLLAFLFGVFIGYGCQPIGHRSSSSSSKALEYDDYDYKYESWGRAVDL